VKDIGSGKLYDKERKVLHGTAVNKPSYDTHKTSCQTDEEIQDFT
jgi:hypothetical protein